MRSSPDKFCDGRTDRQTAEKWSLYVATTPKRRHKNHDVVLWYISRETSTAQGSTLLEAALITYPGNCMHSSSCELIILISLLIQSRWSSTFHPLAYFKLYIKIYTNIPRVRLRVSLYHIVRDEIWEGAIVEY
jgi:hypothetical protein